MPAPAGPSPRDVGGERGSPRHLVRRGSTSDPEVMDSPLSSASQLSPLGLGRTRQAKGPPSGKLGTWGYIHSRNIIHIMLLSFT